MTTEDLPEINRISTEIHPDFYEAPEIFTERLQLFPQGCYSAVNTNQIVGYCISHPWVLGEIPALNTLLHNLPSTPNCLYLHDMALKPSVRGRGLPTLLIPQLSELAKKQRWKYVAGVAVHDTILYWKRFGFRSVPTTPKKLQSYGLDAHYIVLDLAASGSS